jgi:hypothetical protein
MKYITKCTAICIFGLISSVQAFAKLSDGLVSLKNDLERLRNSKKEYIEQLSRAVPYLTEMKEELKANCDKALSSCPAILINPKAGICKDCVELLDLYIDTARISKNAAAIQEAETYYLKYRTAFFLQTSKSRTQ